MESISAEVKTVPPLPIYRHPAAGVAFALIQAMVLGSSRDAEASLSPALSCLYRFDTYITVRTTSLVQNVPRGTLSRFASVPSVPRGTLFEAWQPTWEEMPSASRTGIGTDEPAVFVVLPQLKLLGRPPAIDEDCMPGDQRGRWRSEEHDCTGDIHRFADTV
jgi:hypothetical protein